MFRKSSYKICKLMFGRKGFVIILVCIFDYLKNFFIFRVFFWFIDFWGIVKKNFLFSFIIRILFIQLFFYFNVKDKNSIEINKTLVNNVVLRVVEGLRKGFVSLVLVFQQFFFKQMEILLGYLFCFFFAFYFFIDVFIICVIIFQNFNFFIYEVILIIVYYIRIIVRII